MVVARGTDVMERHELALAELCIVGDADDGRAEECITSIYADDGESYMMPDEDGDGAAAACLEDDGTECMLDSMWEDWSEGLVPEEDDDDVREFEGANEWEDEEKGKKKVAQPWASRASGSGTYVRNPETGKMENIDEI